MGILPISPSTSLLQSVPFISSSKRRSQSVTPYSCRSLQIRVLFFAFFNQFHLISNYPNISLCQIQVYKLRIFSVCSQKFSVIPFQIRFNLRGTDLRRSRQIQHLCAFFFQKIKFSSPIIPHYKCIHMIFMNIGFLLFPTVPPASVLCALVQLLPLGAVPHLGKLQRKWSVTRGLAEPFPGVDNGIRLFQVSLGGV